MPKQSNSRKYTLKTVKVLFTLGGNQCAHPTCTNPIIEPDTDLSDFHVNGEICHIFAISEDGPRGKSGLSERELNAPNNLVLLCRHHHGIIDGQHETYPAETLKEWKRAHEEKMQLRLSDSLHSIPHDIISHPYFPSSLVDQKICEELNLLRKSRYFGEFNSTNFAQTLANRIISGDLRAGTDPVRGRTLAWCAQILSRTDKLAEAQEYLQLAKQLDTAEEIALADAFVISRSDGKESAFRALVPINTPMKRTAAFMAVQYCDGPEQALDWLEDSGLSPEYLDSDGKYVLLSHLLKLGKWDAADKTTPLLTQQDFENTPSLHHTVATATLLKAVPEQFRSLIIDQLPLDSAKFRLASDSQSMAARKAAHQHFTRAAEVARQYACPRIAMLDEQFALWLELRTPDTAQDGLRRLKEKLNDPENALSFVQLGVDFNVQMDLTAVERNINQSISLNGEITPETAKARLALAATKKTPKDFASYVEKHHDDLTKCIGEIPIGALLVEMLSRSGQIEKAEEHLTILLNSGLDAENGHRLRRIIAEAEGADPADTRKEQFKQTNATSDLIVLVDELAAQEDWYEIHEFGELLFDRTQSVADAELFAKALTNTHSNTRLVEFLESRSELRTQSSDLQMQYCWGLYGEGRFLDARQELSKLDAGQDARNHRALDINLKIATGDWAALHTIVADDNRAKESRTAKQLLRTAQLAHQIASPYTKELLFAAAKRGSDDPEILMTAYSTAVAAGWDDDQTVADWVPKAVNLSGDSGPVQSISLKEMVDLQPKWHSHVTTSMQKIGRRQAPMFVAGEALNKGLVNFVLFPAFSNLEQRDPRQRIVIPAYSGHRQPSTFDFTTVSIAFDVTALLTLSFLDLLDTVFDAFGTILIPHSTLFWLLEEKQRAAFHQPSRIADAKEIRNLFASGALIEFVPTCKPHDNLVIQVDDELATMIAEAENVSADDEAQPIVVRPSPVHRRGSLTGDEADLSDYFGVISSCTSIVEELRKRGQITAKEERRAIAYLSAREQSWPGQPDIADRAILFLDDLAVAYFQHLGLLGKFYSAGFSAMVPKSVRSEANNLISYESFSTNVAGAIESIRQCLQSRVESGKIQVGKQHVTDGSKRISASTHPTYDLITLADNCDVVIVDDRFINQHSNVENGQKKAAVLSTLDVLDALVADGSITTEQLMEYRTRLRRAGYLFIPVSEDELTLQLRSCRVINGRIVETAELKAIRENLLRARMCDWLQLPDEAAWLDGNIRACVTALKNSWLVDDDYTRARAISNWIIPQIDIHGWAHRMNVDDAHDLVKAGRGVLIRLLLSPPFNATDKAKEAYWSWLETRLLLQVRDAFPEIYEWVVESQIEQVSEIADMDLSREKRT